MIRNINILTASHILIVISCLAALDQYNAARSDGRVVCYYGSWATYRPGLGKFDPENIDPYICTHIIYTFAGLDESTHTIKSLDPYDDLPDNYGKDSYRKFTNLRKINPNLTVLLAIGGWNEGSTKYSEMASNDESRSTFIQSIVPFLKQYGFQGLDFDWEYPTQRGGKPEDKHNFLKLIRGLREELDKHGLLLSAAVSAGRRTIDSAYIISEVSQILDYINIMCYDYHGTWESYTGENSPDYARPHETEEEKTFNLNYSLQYWISQGAPPEKINLGVPLYGHAFTLAGNDHDVYAPSNGPGQEGPYTRQAGTLGYNEICVQLNQGGWTVVRDDYTKVPYAYKGNQWISFDDAESIDIKSKIGLQYGVGGIMVWSIETDDFQGTCGSTYPLLNVINRNFRNGGTTPTSIGTTPSTQPSNPPSTSTLAPSAVCKKPGYQADPIDCHKFYYCQPMPDGSWTEYPFNCNDGLVFDPKTNNCNYPYNVPDCHAPGQN